MSEVLRGLNWGHRRATAPMAAAARAFEAANPGCRLTFDVQPLGGFEHGLGAATADAYDLVVFDHPFCGDIAAERLFRPAPAALADLAETGFVGRSLASYRYEGALWGVPIDGATQAAVYRPDLMEEHGPPPRTWDDVVRLGAAARKAGRWLALALRNPHGYLALAALCGNLGRPFAVERAAERFDAPTLAAAVDALRAIEPYLHPDGVGWNAIDLHEAMVARDDIVYCPLAYAYLTYAEADHRRPLRFADFAGPAAPHHAGTVIGGTGLGITRSCGRPDLAAAFAEHLASAATQTALFAAHHGQPARVEAWDDPATDARFGGAFRAMRQTMDTALIRPRFPGAVRMQDVFGAAFERGWAGGAAGVHRALAALRSW